MCITKNHMCYECSPGEYLINGNLLIHLFQTDYDLFCYILSIGERELPLPGRCWYHRIFISIYWPQLRRVCISERLQLLVPKQLCWAAG